MRRNLFAAIVALLLGSFPAGATILFAGGEDVDFVCTGTCSNSTSASTFRSSFARGSYGSVASASDPPSNRFSTATFTASTSIWVHAQACVGAGLCSTASTTSGDQWLRVMDSGGNATLLLRGTGTANQVKISSRTSGGVFTDLVTCSSAISDSALSQIDLFIDYGASGSVTLFKDSVQVCTYSGDVTNGDGSTTLQAVEFAGVGVGATGYWSEVVVSTTDTRAMALYRLTPNGAGNAVSWGGSNPCTAIVNNNPFNDGSFATSSASDQLLQCTTTNTIPAGTWAVNAVVMSARLRRGTSGPQTFNYSTRTGGSDFTNGVDLSLTTSFANYSNYIQATNPNTTSAWTTSDLTAVGFNIGLKSRP